MPRAYLFTNGILYLILAVVCTVRHGQTAKGTGYESLSPAGHSEYLVVYGGLQLGLALFFFVLARDPAVERLGLQFSVLLYGAIVAYRVITLAIYRPANPVTLGTAALEVILLLWALVAWRRLG